MSHAVTETLEQRQLLSAAFDNSFGGDGTVQGSAGFARDAAITPDGGVVVATDHEMFRFNANGDRDTAFGGGDGVADIIPFARAVEVQSDGRIVVGGSAGNVFSPGVAIGRYNPDGSPDTSFSGDGILVIEGGFAVEAFSSIEDLEILGDGRIVASGNLVPRNNSTQSTQPTVFRITPSGELDRTFSHDGITTLPVAQHAFGTATSLSVRPDGKLAVGAVINEDDALAARVNADGFLDGSFGTQGVVMLDSLRGIEDVEVQFGNKTLISDGYTVIRLNPNGTRDSTFNDIDAAANVGAPGPYLTELEVKPNQDILLLATRGNSITDGSTNVRFEEYLANGAPESSTLLPWGSHNTGVSIEVQGNKAAVAGRGRAFTDAPAFIALSRLTLDGAGGGTGGGLTGTYFDNDNFTSPKFTRVDSTVNFDWGGGSPSPSIAPDTFSVRWTGKITVPTSGTWTFYAPADDRSRLVINGQTVVDYLPGKTGFIGTIALSAGTQYDLILEHREFGGSARAALQWSGPGVTRQVVPTTALTPAPFTPADTIAPTTPTNFRVTRVGHDNIQLAWNPSTDNVGVAGYEISRNGRFIARVGPSFTGFTDVNLQPNTHYGYAVVALDDAGNRSGEATLTTQTSSAPAGTGLQVTYFDNIDFTNPVENGISPTVDYDWGSGKASPFQTDADTFSVRWKGHINVTQSGSYRIGVNSDNGARLWVDGRLIIDNLSPTATVDHSAVVFLSAGRKNDVILEVVEGTGDARARLLWSPPDTPVMSPIPSSALFASMSGAPLVPTNVQAAKVTDGVRVSWNEVAGETGYTIQRRLGVSGTWATVGAAPADASVFTDTSTLTPGTYYYRVRADNRTFGSSQYELSNPVAI